jgi:hypothetical protein
MNRPVLLACLALAAITCVYTWPLPAYVNSAVAHDRTDPLLVTWILWWSSHTMPLTEAWWNAPAFHPSTGVLAFSENLLGLAPLTVPINVISGSPLLAYNVAFLSSYVLSGLGAYSLAFVLTRCHGASFVAAIAFAFAPYRLSHTPHLQLLSSYWMPVAVAALHLYLDSPKWRWAALFAAAWLLQALACGYYLFFLSIFALLWLAWFAPGRLSIRHMVRLGAAWLLAAGALAPVLLGYRAIHAEYGFRRGPVEVMNYSADIAGLFAASPDSLLWGTRGFAVGLESQLFPGLTIVLLLAAGLAVLRTRGEHEARGALLFYIGSAVLMWTLALGPAPKLSGAAIGIPGPYALLAQLPGFDGMRVPARLWMVSVLGLAIAAAYVVARIESRRVRRAVIAAASLGMLLDAWPRTFPVVAAPGTRVTTGGARVRLGLPLHETDTATMFGAIPQGRRVVNGYSGYRAPQYAALRYLLEQRDPKILDRLSATEAIEVIVESAGDPDGGWNAYVQRNTRARRLDSGPDWTGYELAASGAAAATEIRGPSIRIAAIATSANAPDINAVLDGDLETRWHSQPQRGGETITVDLERPQRVAGIVLCLGAYAGQFPRQLQIEASTDGTLWSPVSAGGTALETYDAAIRSPREVPITLPVQREAVRFLRLRQTGSDPHAGWTIVELRVIG